MTESADSAAARLIEAAFRQTLARFEQEAASGARDPGAEIDVYRRRRRDYASLLRLEQIPEEARELAAHLLDTQGAAFDSLHQNDFDRNDFDRDVARMLIRLYDAFIATAMNRDQGSR
ncbi:MAG TPA: hypothetical protein VF267_01500 [Gammaproteobacteria bacterium]